MPNTSETATIPVQSHAIAIKIPPPEAGFGLFYARAAGKYALRAEQPKFLYDFLKKFKKMLDITAHILYDRQVREWEYPAQTRAKLR